MNQNTIEELAFEMTLRGFCVVENVIPGDRCREISRSIIETVRRECEHYQTGVQAAENKIGFTPSVINHDQSFADYLANERLLSLLERLLGRHLRISFTSAIINHPGNCRGNWHADWPFNQHNAGHVPAPYADAIMHVTTLWMLSSFSTENGGTLVLPGSHRLATNPTAKSGPEPASPLATEANAAGAAGSVLVMDSRLWHATAANQTSQPRVALAVRYAPWWLNLEVLRPDSDQRKRLCDESGKSENIVPSIKRPVFDRLSPRVQPLYRHWLES